MFATPVLRHALGRGISSTLFGVANGKRRSGGARGPSRYALQGLGDDAQPVFNPSVEQWRSMLEKYASGMPVPFLLAWLQKESNGNPCSYTSLHESGIFQLMPGQNMQAGGTTEGELRAACIGASQQASRQLTGAELERQVESGVQYVQWARAQAHAILDAAGVKWDESSPSFWQLVKLVFNYPAPIPGWLANATAVLGRPPADWAEFRSTITGYSSVLDNAEWVGSFGIGGGGVLSSLSPNSKTVLVVGGVLLTLLVLRKKRRI